MPTVAKARTLSALSRILLTGDLSLNKHSTVPLSNAIWVEIVVPRR